MRNKELTLFVLNSIVICSVAQRKCWLRIPRYEFIARRKIESLIEDERKDGARKPYSYQYW